MTWTICSNVRLFLLDAIFLTKWLQLVRNAEQMLKTIGKFSHNIVYQ